MYYIHPICCRQQWKKNNDICQSWTSEDWSVIRVRTPLEISFILSFCGLSLGARHFRFACLNIFHIFFSNNVILYWIYSHVIVCLWKTWIYLNTVGIVTVCVFVCHLFSFYPFYFDFHSARIIFDVFSGFYLWNINKTTAWHL